jgi:hypothetical protein
MMKISAMVNETPQANPCSPSKAHIENLPALRALQNHRSTNNAKSFFFVTLAQGIRLALQGQKHRPKYLDQDPHLVDVDESEVHVAPQ